MTLAQDYLQRGVVYRNDGDDIRKKVHEILVEHLRPIGNDPGCAKSYAEQFVFDEDVGPIMQAIVGSEQVSRGTLLDMARLPSSSTWIEWPVLTEFPGTKLGVLMVQDVIVGGSVPQTGLFFVMRTGKTEHHHVGCFGCVGMQFPITNDSVMSVAFWKDFVGGDCATVPEEVMKDVRAFAWDAVEALFLIMTPRVCEVREAACSAKANRRRAASGKLPLVEYKRMILKVGVGTPRYASHGGPAPLVKDTVAYHKRLHRVIGHFRTYRAGRQAPLVSFVPEHWRGDVELGVVLKTRHVKGEH